MRGAVSDPLPADAFVFRILQNGSIPSWLRPIPYPMPLQEDLANQHVLLFEVAPDQTPDEATVRAAQSSWTEDKIDEALKQLGPLLTRAPDYLPALVCLGRVQRSRGDLDAFRQTMQRVRANLDKAGTLRLDDRVDLAVIMALANDPAQVREQITGALQHADEGSLRHLLPDALINLVAITRQMKLTEEYTKAYQLAFALLPP